jgi:hypothetical protein
LERGILTEKGGTFIAVVKWQNPAAEIMLCRTNFIYDEITEKCRKRGTLKEHTRMRWIMLIIIIMKIKMKITSRRFRNFGGRSGYETQKVNNITLHDVITAVPRCNK